MVTSTRTNLVVNPRPGHGATLEPWGLSPAGSGEPRREPGPDGVPGILCITGQGSDVVLSTYTPAEVGPGSVYGALWVRSTVGLSTLRLQLGVAGVGSSMSDPVTVRANVWTEISHVYAAPSVGSNVSFMLFASDLPAGEELCVTMAYASLSPGPFFDGATPDAVDEFGRGTRTWWNGAPFASTSTERYVWNDKPDETNPEPFPLRFTVFNRNYDRLGWINAPRSANVTIRHNAISTCEFVLDDDHPLAGDLATRGSRVIVEYMGLGEPIRLMSGIVSATGSRDGSVGTVTYSVKDDKSLFWELLGWPAPTKPIDQQGDDEEDGPYYVLNGQSAEYTLKRVVERNIPHVDLPVSIAPNQGRGDQLNFSIRFHPIADRILPMLDQAGIGMDCYQDGAGVLVDVYEPVDRTDRPPLTEASGVVVDGTWSQEPPTVTRVVVGGPGEGKARRFVRVPAAANLPSDREVMWGVSIEQWIDARDLEETSGTLVADMQRRGQTALDDGAPQYRLSAVLSETPAFRFGVAYGLGDILPVQLDGAPVITDRVRSISFELSPSDGLVITPTIGLEGDWEHVTFRHLVRIAQGLRNQEVSR